MVEHHRVLWILLHHFSCIWLCSISWQGIGCIFVTSSCSFQRPKMIHTKEHSPSFCGLIPRNAVLCMQRLRLFLIFVLFSLIVALSFVGTAGNMGKMSIPPLRNLPINNVNVNPVHVPRPNSRPPPQKQAPPKQAFHSEESSSGSPDRTYYNVSSPYNNIITSCSLVSLGERYHDDKFTNHNYQNLYCEVLRDFQRSQRKMRMLEIGFGCGHNVNTPNQQGECLSVSHSFTP